MVYHEYALLQRGICLRECNDSMNDTPGAESG